jgi:hypothetical protein
MKRLVIYGRVEFFKWQVEVSCISGDLPSDILSS